jgi:SPP1 gp7 family putative phage head morphogenesis protein
MAAPPRKPLDRSIRIVRNALTTCADLYLREFLRDLRHLGSLDDSSVRHSLSHLPNIDRHLQTALSEGWEYGWRSTSLELQALVRRNPRRWQRYDRRVEQHAQELPAQQPGLRLPSPVTPPSKWRTWAETHTPAEGGTADAAQSRTTAEWLAEHEATVSKFIPTEYRDAYLERRLPPLKLVTEEQIKNGCREAARDAAAAIAERGFGVREGMDAIREFFPQHAGWQLERIARTEGATLYENGRMGRYRADPLVIGWRFTTVGDSRLCDLCTEFQDKCFQSEGGEYCPPLHPDCRCTLEPLLIDEADSVEWADAGSFERLPAEGFGRPDFGVLPANAGQEQLPFLD